MAGVQLADDLDAAMQPAEVEAALLPLTRIYERMGLSAVQLAQRWSDPLALAWVAVAYGQRVYALRAANRPADAPGSATAPRGPFGGMGVPVPPESPAGAAPGAARANGAHAGVPDLRLNLEGA